MSGAQGGAVGWILLGLDVLVILVALVGAVYAGYQIYLGKQLLFALVGGSGCLWVAYKLIRGLRG